MALSAEQKAFPEPDTGPMRAFVPLKVNGRRIAITHGAAILMGMQELGVLAEADGVRLVGKPRFVTVTIPATQDVFLMGEQDWEAM